ncbi:MAG: hypothetical protein HOI55_13130 [Candidatus Marinimicrobia bacterium]|jgi:hypothetical protein|nr:hypothetical protein [Candidatus Neomarinimicrobiota bacterium]
MKHILKKIIQESYSAYIEKETEIMSWLSGMKNSGMHPSDYGDTNDILVQAEIEGLVSNNSDREVALHAIQLWLDYN